MKKINYTCDVCGNDIEPICRPLYVNGNWITSCNPTYIKLDIKQVNPRDNHSERTATIDLCDICYDKLQNLIKENHV